MEYLPILFLNLEFPIITDKLVGEALESTCDNLLIEIVVSDFIYLLPGISNNCLNLLTNWFNNLWHFLIYLSFVNKIYTAIFSIKLFFNFFFCFWDSSLSLK